MLLIVHYAAMKDSNIVSVALPLLATGKQAYLPCLQVLTEELPALIAGLSFKRSMRWNGKAAFSRPLRWLLALHGSTVLPFVYAGLRAGCRTRLLRTTTATHNECQVCGRETLTRFLCCNSGLGISASASGSSPTSELKGDRALYRESSWHCKHLTQSTVIGSWFLGLQQAFVALLLLS